MIKAWFNDEKKYYPLIDKYNIEEAKTSFILDSLDAGEEEGADLKLKGNSGVRIVINIKKIWTHPVVCIGPPPKDLLIVTSIGSMWYCRHIVNNGMLIILNWIG